MRTRLSIALAALALLAFGAGAGAADHTLTAGGDVYFAEAGLYGDLFPDGSAAAEDAPVLALGVLRGDGSAERQLVPGSEGAEAETVSSLVAGPDGETIYLLWQTDTEQSRLRLSGLGAEGWRDEVDVSRGSEVVAGSPRVVATRDSSLLVVSGGGGEGGAGEARVSRRSVLHVVWRQADGEAIYAPLVIEDGSYLGDHALIDLARFVPADLEPGEPLLAGSSLLTLEPGSEGAVVAAFSDAASQHLISLELRPISGELSEIGDRLRDGLLDFISQLEPGDPESLDSLAGGARAQLIGVGRQLRPAVLGILAADLESYVLETGGDWAFQPEVMTARTRAHVIELGASFDHTSISSLHGGARAQLIGVGHHLEAPDRSHDLSVRVAAARPAPELPPEAVSAVYLSASGRDALVAWEQGELVLYRESDGDAWGETVTLGIEAGADPALIRELLSERARSH